MQFCVDNYHRFAPEFLEDPLRPLLMDAWGELREVFQECEVRIRRAPLRWLRLHGLTGAQLQLKVATVDRAHDSAMRQLQVENPPPRPGYAGIVKWLLDAIDNLLDSLARVVPLVDAIAELKKHLAWVADRGKERTPT